MFVSRPNLQMFLAVFLLSLTQCHRTIVVDEYKREIHKFDTEPTIRVTFQAMLMHIAGDWVNYVFQRYFKRTSGIDSFLHDLLNVAQDEVDDESYRDLATPNDWWQYYQSFNCKYN